MKTNFFRSTIILVLIIIIPIIISGLQLVEHYNSNKNNWHYILSMVGVSLLSLFFLAGFSLLIYSFFLTKNPSTKK